MELGSYGTWSVYYYNNILERLPNPDYSLDFEVNELGNHEARFMKYYYFILGSLPNLDDSMDLENNGSRTLCN